jgi:hypothetical protein
VLVHRPVADPPTRGRVRPVDRPPGEPRSAGPSSA